MISISGVIINLLNGANDSYGPRTDGNKSDSDRYFPNVNNDLVVSSKSLACDILVKISHLEADAKCHIFTATLKHDIEEQGHGSVMMRSTNVTKSVAGN